MRSLVLMLALFASPLAAQDLPPQRDLDLPILLENYKPEPPKPQMPPVPTPQPSPPPSPTDDPKDVPPPAVDDPRDEPPPVFYGEEIDVETDTLIYVIDVSGSMSREGRLDRAKLELKRSIAGLSPTLNFNVISYACSMKSWRPAMVPASNGNKASAIAWTQGLIDYGSTGTGPAVSLALSDKQCDSVVLLTDGAPNCGARDIDGHRRMISAANTQGATINVFGIDARSVYREWCQQVAADSGGSYFDVP